MVVYAARHKPRERPSEDQRKFLELLRDLGPRDNAQTAAVRTRAIQLADSGDHVCSYATFDGTHSKSSRQRFSRLLRGVFQA